MKKDNVYLIEIFNNLQRIIYNEDETSILMGLRGGLPLNEKDALAISKELEKLANLRNDDAEITLRKKDILVIINLLTMLHISFDSYKFDTKLLDDAISTFEGYIFEWLGPN